MTDRLKRAIQKCGYAVTESEQLDAMEAVEDALREIVEDDRRRTIQTCKEVAAKCGHIGMVWEAFDALLEA